MIKLNVFPLDLEYDDSEKKLYFEGVELSPNVRTLGEMSSVVLDKVFFEKADKKRIQYYMFREIAKKGDVELFKTPPLELSYDITVIPTLDLGREFNKTLGHYHPKSPFGARYAEIYEVLEGEGHYLLQRLDEKTGNVDDVMLVIAKKGDKVVVPNGYGHISINPSSKTLVSANITGVFKSEYDPYRLKGGGAYYELIDDSLSPNENYANLPLIKTVDAMDLPLNQQFDGDNIYAQFVENPTKFDFLKK
ncbi:MAG: glucose-6-phosphate isomerase family protein [Candidatus Norongarragalinales archaeon]